MKTPRLLVLAACLAAPAASTGVAVAGEAHTAHGAPASPQPDPAGFAARMHAAMATMDRDMHAAPVTGDPDRDFVAMMLPHHQGAVDMARALLLHTRDPELRNLAQSIIAGQQVEIALMQAWARRHAGASPVHAQPTQGGTP